MKINIKTVGVELAPEIREYVEKKLAVIERFGHLMGEDAALHLILGKTTEHHKGGADAFSAEIQLRAMGRDIVAKSFGADIRAAIDGLKDELSKTLVSGADKKRTLLRRGASAVKNFLKGGK